MKEFSTEEINSRIPTEIPEHIDRNPVPQGDNPNEYLQASELNKIVKFLDENTSFIKELMQNSNELHFDVNNYITYYHSDEEFTELHNEGLDNKIYFNSNTRIVRFGLLDSDGYEEFDFSQINKVAQLKTALDNEIVERARVDALKLNKPTENATNQYVILGDGSTTPKGDLGKNFANTDLNVTTNRKHTGTASVEFAMPFICSNSSVRYSGLADKSADATFKEFALFDSNGNLAKASQIANAFEAGLLNTSAEQGLRIGQLLNGGQGSSGAIYVNNVSPLVIQNQYNTDESVILTGANLLLNSLAMSISILASDKITVVATVPNNQITNNSTSELRFLYNFYQFPTGTYYLKITSGVKSYVVPLDLKVVSAVDNININDIVWEKLYESSITPNPLDGAVGGNFTNVSPIGNSLIPVVSYKSSELFAIGENFYIEMKINLAVRANGGTSYIPSYVGLGYSQTLNSLTPSSLVYFEWSWAGSSTWYLAKNNGQLFFDGPSPVEFTVVIIKTGNLFRTIIGNSSVSKTISNNSGYSIFLQFVSRLSETTVQGQITKAFKFT